MKYRVGFTLVEMMVVVAIVGILASVATISFSDSSKQSRDAQRQADLRTLQAAVELYKQEYGRYPESCKVSETAHWNTGEAWEPENPANFWSGQVGTDYECPGGSSEYISNDLSATVEKENFVPKFLPRLPVDPKLNGNNSGYVYLTNPEGTVYKLIALNTVESEGGVGYLDDFARCGNMSDNSNTCVQIGTNPGNSNGAATTQCQTPEIANDFAVWGGFAPGGQAGASYFGSTPVHREFFSDVIHCR